MKGKYKRKQFWCSTCDAEIVEVGTKCSNCGCREYASKIKKKTAMKKDIEYNKREIVLGDEVIGDVIAG